MNATVITNLNIRIRPSVNAARVGYYKPGDQLDIADTVNGEFIPVGAIDRKKQIATVTTINSKMGVDKLKSILMNTPVEYVDYNPPYKKKYGIINPRTAISLAKGES
jgi:hypothetical protein